MMQAATVPLYQDESISHSPVLVSLTSTTTYVTLCLVHSELEIGTTQSAED